MGLEQQLKMSSFTTHSQSGSNRNFVTWHVILITSRWVFANWIELAEIVIKVGTLNIEKCVGPRKRIVLSLENRNILQKCLDDQKLRTQILTKDYLNKLTMSNRKKDHLKTTKSTNFIKTVILDFNFNFSSSDDNSAA